MGILYTEEALLTMKNLYKDYQVFEPVIFGTKKLGDTPIEVLNTQAPYLVSDLNEAKRQTINDFLSFIGVENTGAEKRERMNMTESSAGMRRFLSDFAEIEVSNNFFVQTFPIRFIEDRICR